MKYVLLILFSFPLFSIAQTNNTDSSINHSIYSLENNLTRDSLGLLRETNSFIIGPKNSRKYFNLAKKYIDENNIDSLNESYFILQALNYEDSPEYPRKLIDSFNSKIEELNFKYYKEQVLGKWTLSWSGSNLSYTNDTVPENEIMVISQNEVQIFRNKNLVRRTKYFITNSHADIWKEFDFQLCFVDKNECFHIGILKKGIDYHAKLEFDSAHVGLEFNSGEFCSDCGYEIYTKNAPPWCVAHAPIANYNMEPRRLIT